MKRFRLRQDVSVTEEDGTPVKEFSVDMWVSTEGISEDSVKDMFELFSNGFTGLLEEVSFVKDKKEEIEFMSDDIRKGW
ncbi:MAG: hypothetical protein PUC39_03700 [Lachnospiraceae bacterium]|nr:hypothetical protein [Lachnospiraceae bacterium]